MLVRQPETLGLGPLLPAVQNITSERHVTTEEAYIAACRFLSIVHVQRSVLMQTPIGANSLQCAPTETAITSQALYHCMDFLESNDRGTWAVA